MMMRAHDISSVRLMSGVWLVRTWLFFGGCSGVGRKGFSFIEGNGLLGLEDVNVMFWEFGGGVSFHLG